MDPVLRTLVLERLRASALVPEAARLIEVACAGEAPGGAAAPPVWLRSVTVEGFRGIGAAATLELEPAPGLTVVVGRNGSGKSSFAEGLELLMTGGLKRWEKRPRAWTETWQCLHHDGPTRLAAELVVEGAGEAVELVGEWPHGASHDDASGRGPAAAALAAGGWDRRLGSFRPFLSYAELATMFDTLSSLYEALTPVLGLADLDAVARGLADLRLALEGRRKEAKAQLERLLARLDAQPGDARAAQLRAAAGARTPDLEAVAALLAGAPAADQSGLATLRRLAGLAPPAAADIKAAFSAVRTAERARADAASTDVTRASALAALLRQALAVRDPAKLTDDCPVCGTTDVLDAAWAEHAAGHAAALDEQAAALRAAEARVAAARHHAGTLLAGLQTAPAAAREAGLEAEDLPPLDSAAAVLRAADALRGLAERAGAALARRDSAWHELASLGGEWLERAREVKAAAPTLRALKDAEAWLKEAAGDLRAERFAPIAERAIANWRELRQGSSVDLHEITLRKVGRGGRADFDVRADGEGANALGVMSQGELLALSVSVFLPRAALEESPFRFAVIDDPVQAMDPAKVDGLARVLHRAARTRQIVVFTHDDRLPEAIRRLRLDARILRVDRRARSSVVVDPSRSPVSRYLDGARRYAQRDRLPAEVQARVVPMFCRNALEAAAADIVRRRAVREGGSLHDADEALEEARSLRETLALALFGEAGRQGEVATVLRERHGQAAATLMTTLNAGVHGQLAATTIERLPNQTRDLIHELMG